ncbi:MAG: 50S ribosomal protein L22 [Desulfobacterales bacterium]|jgi:large subunit ribosomal protein L22|nr:50S ribosomal protein L22 [Desulfobacterales bacterium]
MDIMAKGKFLRISPQKVRLIADVVKGKPVEIGLNTLKFMPNKAAGLVGKILKSAVANADQNAKLNVDSLFIKNIIVDGGPTMKRFGARARGRGTRILKRSSHITVVVAQR